MPLDGQRGVAKKSLKKCILLIDKSREYANM